MDWSVEVNPFAFLRRRGPGVFHLRMGGCNGCAEMVDAVLRDAKSTAPVECSSPRHAEVVVVTGFWAPELALAALRVISQAPSTCRLVVAGDCALGRGFLVERLKLGEVKASLRIEPDLEIAGCPVETGALLEGVRRVAG